MLLNELRQLSRAPMNIFIPNFEKQRPLITFLTPYDYFDFIENSSSCVYYLEEIFNYNNFASKLIASLFSTNSRISSWVNTVLFCVAIRIFICIQHGQVSQVS